MRWIRPGFREEAPSCSAACRMGAARGQLSLRRWHTCMVRAPASSNGSCGNFKQQKNMQQLAAAVPARLVRSAGNKELPGTLLRVVCLFLHKLAARAHNACNLQKQQPQQSAAATAHGCPQACQTFRDMQIHAWVVKGRLLAPHAPCHCTRNRFHRRPAPKGSASTSACCPCRSSCTGGGSTSGSSSRAVLLKRAAGEAGSRHAQLTPAGSPACLRNGADPPVSSPLALVAVPEGLRGLEPARRGCNQRWCCKLSHVAATLQNATAATLSVRPP